MDSGCLTVHVLYDHDTVFIAMYVPVQVNILVFVFSAQWRSRCECMIMYCLQFMYLYKVNLLVFFYLIDCNVCTCTK